MSHGPKDWRPRPGGRPAEQQQPAARADVLVVTWTVDEGHALSRVLTPGKDSRNDYRPTRTTSRRFPEDAQGLPGATGKASGRVLDHDHRKKSVVIFKSDSHMSQDGPQLPNIDVWRQIIHEVQPKLVITTGTAGGIGKQFEVGDVIVSPVCRFDCTAKFKKKPFAQSHFASTSAKATQNLPSHARCSRPMPGSSRRTTSARRRLFGCRPKALDSSVVTTDFFGFDTSNDHYKLQGLGDVSEMGDAMLGLVASDMGESAPRWLAIRNVSDPQIKADGLTLRQQAMVAAQIYKGFGRWSSVCSAITCWASIAAE